jgi:hypothetical protein
MFRLPNQKAKQIKFAAFPLLVTLSAVRARSSLDGGVLKRAVKLAPFDLRN